MTKYTKVTSPPGQMSDWIPPVQTGYKMKCCDCGLVHVMDFKVVKVLKEDETGLKTVVDVDPKYQALFRARRDNRATAAGRRKRKKA